MATAGPLRTERVSVLYQPNSGVEDLTRAGEEPGPEAEPRGTRTRRGPAWTFSSSSVSRAPWSRRRAGLWRRVLGLSGGSGLLSAALAEPWLSTKSWLGQSQHGDGELDFPRRGLSRF